VPSGQDFATLQQEAISRSETMLVVIGSEWLDAREARGTPPRRTRRPDRNQFGTALTLGKRVVPVLLGGATMPREGQVPPSLQGLARPQTLDVVDDRWADGIDRLFGVTLAAGEKIPLLPVALDDSPLSPGLRYFFAAGQRLDLSGLASHERLDRNPSAVEQGFPARI